MATPAQARAAIARAARTKDPKARAAAITEARRQYAAVLIEDRIKSVVDSMPRLTADQVAELQALLGGAA